MINEFKNNQNLNSIDYINDYANEATRFLSRDFNDNQNDYDNLIYYINDYDNKNVKFMRYYN